MISEVVAKELDKNKQSSSLKSLRKSIEIEGTFEIRVNSNADKKFLYKFIRKYKHWQNIITKITI